MPDRICELCRNKLDDTYNFKRQILSTDEKLREQISTLNLIKIEKEEWIEIEYDDNVIQDTETNQNCDSEDEISVFNTEFYENDNNNQDKPTKSKNKLKLSKQEDKNIAKVCPECGKLLKKDSYRDHVLTQHNQEFKYDCDICGIKCKTKRQLWHHKNVKHEERGRVNCDQCVLTFSTQNTFRRHYNNVHLGVLKDQMFTLWVGIGYNLIL